MSKRTCAGICKTFRVRKPHGATRYGSGQCRCQTCSIWLDYKGCHLLDGSRADSEHGGWYCNCCNFRVRRTPRNIEYKTKFRRGKGRGASSGVDLSYFNEIRVAMVKAMALCMPKERSDFRSSEFSDGLERCGIPASDIESEFDCSMKAAVELAYSSKPPNRLSMMIAFERVRSEIGRIPTRSDLEERSGLPASRYDSEFRSWENMLEIFGYADSRGDDHRDAEPRAAPDMAGLDRINRQIQDALSLIKSTPGGIRIDEIERRYRIPAGEVPTLVTRLVRVDGIVKKEAPDGVAGAAVLLYEEPRRDRPDHVHGA